MNHAPNLSTADFQRIDAAHHVHPFTDTKALNEEKSRVMTRGDGVWLWDTEGTRYLDGMAGLWCTQIGHGRREIADAVQSLVSYVGREPVRGGANRLSQGLQITALTILQSCFDDPPPNFQERLKAALPGALSLIEAFSLIDEPVLPLGME